MKKKLMVIIVIFCILSIPIPCYSNAEIDLTKLNKLMAYTKLCDIIKNPGNYVGKTIRLEGNFYDGTLINVEDGFHFVMLMVDQCCFQALPFMWVDEHKNPKDYHKDAELVEVIGKMVSDSDTKGKYYYLIADDLIKKQ